MHVQPWDLLLSNRNSNIGIGTNRYFTKLFKMSAVHVGLIRMILRISQRLLTIDVLRARSQYFFQQNLKFLQIVLQSTYLGPYREVRFHM